MPTILHIITSLEAGGTEKALLRLLLSLPSQPRHHVCCLKGHGPIGTTLENAGINVTYLNLNPLNPLRAVIRFHKITKQLKPPILSLFLIHADLFGRIFGRLFGIPTIISNQRGSLEKWEWLRALDRLTAPLVTHFTVQTLSAKNELSRLLNQPPSKFTVIPNGINVNDFNISINKAAQKRSLNIPDNCIVITSIAHLRPYKGHNALIKAFEKVFTLHTNIRLLMIGDGPLHAQIEHTIKSAQSAPAIQLLGKREDIPKILAVTDIFVLPSAKEGMSNALLEAAASGKAIIASDTPENRTIITNNHSGLLTQYNDTASLAKAMQILLSSPQKRTQLGTHAKISANRFSLEKQAHLFARLTKQYIA